MPKKKKKFEIKYITQAGLRGKRGWTGSLIKRFLKEPDLIKDNPHYANSAPMYLYLIERVDAIERTPEFIVMRGSAEVRKRTAGKAVQTKVHRIMAYVQMLNIQLPDMNRDELIKKACDSYNSHKSWSAYECGHEFTPATENSDRDFLNRICINYLRHNCTRYERQLEQIFGKVGNQQAYELLKEKVNKAIVEKYEFLQ